MDVTVAGQRVAVVIVRIWFVVFVPFREGFELLAEGFVQVGG